jgi:hypothetical protein
MKFMMKKMMPMMSGTIEKMEYEEKEEMMDQMMPHMLANMTFEEKMKMMSKMMPFMMEDIDPSQMSKMMDTMMPMMMGVMEKKGIKMMDMMQMMCPKCISVATSNASGNEKKKLKEQMTRSFSSI